MSSFIRPSSTISRRVRVGIRCPDCDGQTRVSSTRSLPGEKIERTRICKDCGRRISTTELIVGSQSLT